MSIAKKLKIIRGKTNQGEVGMAIWPDEKLNFKQAQQRISRIEKLPDDQMPLGILKKLADHYRKPMSYFTGEGGGEPPCGILDRTHVESICRKIGGVYGSGNKAAINSLECHLEGLVSMLSNKETVNEIMNGLNVLMSNHEDLRRELNTIQTDIGGIKGEKHATMSGWTRSKNF